MKSRCLTHLIGFAVVEKNHDGGITHAPVKDEIEKAITSELPVLTVTNLRGFGALAPIPSGIVMITTSVKPADLRNERKQ